MSYDLGDVVTLTFEVKNDGLLVDAGSVALTITKPDATTETPVVTHPSIGIYQAEYVPLTAGPYGVRWVATGVNARALTDFFDVRASDPPLLFSLVDAKRMLAKVTSADDENIRELLESTTSIVEGIVGPVVRRSVTEVVGANGAYAHFVTSLNPIISIQSIAPIGKGLPTYIVDDFDIDYNLGVVRSKLGRAFWGPQRVVYTVGRSYVPAAIRDAGRMTLRWLWSFQLGPHSGPRDRTQATSGLSVELPKPVIELLRPYARTGGFA